MIFVFQLMFFDTQISIRNRLGYVCIEYAAYCIEYARIEHAKVRAHQAVCPRAAILCLVNWPIS